MKYKLRYTNNIIFISFFYFNYTLHIEVQICSEFYHTTSSLRYLGWKMGRYNYNFSFKLEKTYLNILLFVYYKFHFR